MRKIRGKGISFVFQEPMTSFNPVQTIGAQISEAMLVHKDEAPDEARKIVTTAMKHTGINDPERVYKAYPYELSGGMRQRAMIAMALILKPELLIADEPTTALDVTIQAQILELLNQLKEEMGLSVLLITHNLGIVAENAQRVLVMYAGRMAEMSGVEEFFRKPLNPYSRGLLASVPSIDSRKVLSGIGGSSRIL